MTDFSESYSNKLLKGIVKYSHEHSPWVMCKMPLSLRDGGKMNEVLDFAVMWRADAIIGQFRSGDNVGMFRKKGIIAIAQDYQKRFPSISNISGDYHQAGKICADYFIRRGVKNYAFYGLKDVVWSTERKEGYEEEIRQRVGDCTISVQEGIYLSDTWWYDLSKLTEWLKALPKPVAILACDDNRAYHIIEACQMSGEPGLRIPEDILVLGVDNDESLCTLSSPPLSSLNQDVEKAGYNTAAMIDEMLEMPLSERFDHIRDVVVRHTFITTRRSTDAFIHDNPYISHVMYYIYSHLNSHLCVDDIVKEVPMSRRLLEETFRKEVGTSIYQYIINARVEKLKDLIRNGYTPLQGSIVLEMDYKILARSFKKVTGMSPGEFARSVQLDKQ